MTELAFSSIAEDRSLKMSRNYVIKKLSEQLPMSEAATALEEIIKSGLFIENNGYIEWFHPSLRDYLAAKTLIALIEQGKHFADICLGKPQWINTVAFAVGFSTQPGLDIENRSRIFKSFLKHKPPIEAVLTVVPEYHISMLIGEYEEYIDARNELNELKWGSRFLETYKLFVDIGRSEKIPNIEQIPSSAGIDVYISDDGNFCTVIYTDNNGVRFYPLEKFNEKVMCSGTINKEIAGFSFHTSMSPLIDPEIMAFMQVGTLLKMKGSQKDDNRVSRWHKDISSYCVVTPDEWVTWYNPEKMTVLEKTKHGVNTVLLSWHDFYTPATFLVSPKEIPARRSMLSTRQGGIVFTMQPPTRIMVALELPWNRKSVMIDLPTKVFVPFPIQLLNNMYLVEWISLNWQKGESFTISLILRG